MSVDFNHTNVDEQTLKRLQAQRQAAYQNVQQNIPQGVQQGARQVQYQTQTQAQQQPQIQAQPQKDGFFTGLGSNLVINGIMTGGYGAITDVVQNRGIKKTINVVKNNNEVVSKILKNDNIKADVFTKNYALAKNYEKYISIQSEIERAEGIIKQAAENKLKIPILTQITNLKDTFLGKGKSQQALKDAIVENAKASKKAAQTAQKAILNGQDALGITKLSLRKNATNLFKEELLNPINLLFVVTNALGRIQNEAVPAFKNEGFVAGMKKLGSVALKTVADVISNAGFSVIGRIAGSAIGSIFGPAGARVGGQIGDCVGSFISNKIIVKIFGEDEVTIANNYLNENSEAQNAQEQLAQDQSVYANTMQQQGYQTQQTQQTQQNYQAEAPRRSAYIRPQNGVYATEWVNQINRNALSAEGQLRGYYA